MSGSVSKISASVNGFFVGLFGGVASILFAMILAVFLSSISSPLAELLNFKVFGFLVSGLIISIAFGLFYQWRLGLNSNDGERTLKLIYYWGFYLAGIVLFVFLFNVWSSGPNYWAG